MKAIAALLHEIADGPAEEEAWVLNPGDPGLLRSLDVLTAAQASAPAPDGGPSIAAHVDHLRYGLELLNRSLDGEDPFADADYAASWRRLVVTAPEWAERRQQLATEARRLQVVVQQPRELSGTQLTGVLAAVVHLAYHLGAIRQLDRATKGPPARD